MVNLFVTKKMLMKTTYEMLHMEIFQKKTQTDDLFFFKTEAVKQNVIFVINLKNIIPKLRALGLIDHLQSFQNIKSEKDRILLTKNFISWTTFEPDIIFNEHYGYSTI